MTRKSRIHILHTAFWSLLFVSLSLFQQKHRIHFTDFTEVPPCPSSSSFAPHPLQEQEHAEVQAGAPKHMLGGCSQAPTGPCTANTQ